MHSYSGGTSDILALKLNGSGTYQWHTFYGGASSDTAYGIDVNTSGDISIVGSSSGSWTGPSNAAPLNTFTNGQYGYESDITVLGLNSSAAYQWHTFYGSPTTDYAEGVVATPCDTYITGTSGQSWNGPGNISPLNPGGPYASFNAFVVNMSSTTNTITVTNTNDSGVGSLRQAIADVCPGGTINFAPSLSGQAITLASTLVIDKDMTIDGSALNPKITISGNNTVGVMQTKSINGITLDSLLITNGNYLWGGGINNLGVLTLMNCVVSNNNSDNNGGGVVNFGELTLINTAVSGNTAATDGGGIYNDYYVGSVSGQSGKMAITDSIIADNTADYGGGIYTRANGEVVTVINSNFSGNSAVFANGGGIYSFGTLDVLDSTFTENTADGDGGAIYNSYESTLTVMRSTFSGNSAPGMGGGVYNDATSVLNVTNSTFVKNSSGNGGAIFNYHNAFYAGILSVTNSTFSANSAVYHGGGIYNFGTLNLTNSILANSVTGDDCYHDDFNGGTIGTNVNNLIEDNWNCGTPASTADPNLGPLADNGGSTQTIPLQAGSSAIDAGNDSVCPTTDQRGVTRPFGSHCDIGAYEYEHAKVNVTIGVNPPKNYTVAPSGRITNRYGINGGPVRVRSTNGMSIFTSQRAIYGSSFNSIVGFPADQLTTEYWFTSLDDTGMITYLVIGNPSETETALVDVYIGGVKKNTTPYSIPPGQRVYPRYGINGGPVRVVSTNGVSVFTSERTKYGNSFNEVMGFPRHNWTQSSGSRAMTMRE
ncbi:MAG: hypothetical protein IPP66_21745 [Anaerolineales bacterium]|nr:hypothetical protein [Anaerolineales bacterium]